MNIDLTGRTALVTGPTDGIGFAAAMKLAGADAHAIEIGDSTGDIHRAAAEPVEFGDDEHVTILQPVEQAGKALAFFCRGRPGDGFGDHPPRLCCKASSLDLVQLVFGSLVDGGHTQISKGA